MNQDITYEYDKEGLNKYLIKCLLWVGAGLLVTAGIAFTVVSTGLVYSIFSNPVLLIVLTIAELAVVVVFSFRVNKMSVTSAYICFFTYAALTGITFSMYGLLYQAKTIYLAFGFTAVLFVNMVAIGYFTKRDLSKFTSVLFAGLITIGVFSLLNIFMKLAFLDTILCYAGILIFLGITAWDIQKIKNDYIDLGGNQEALQKASIYGALSLYLDFINIFIRILRLLGRNRN